MNADEIIRKKLDVRRVSSPPILCWIGTGRHKLHDPSVGRNAIAELFMELGFNNGVEVGVDRGYYSDVLLSVNPGLTLTGIDSWQGERAEDHYCDAQQRLVRHKERSNLVRSKSLEAADSFSMNSLDFAYIDSSRDFNSVSMDLIRWGRNVKQGGIISGRGYCHLFETGVVTAVNAYTYAHNIRNWYITRDIEPNYLFIKTWISN